MAKYVEKFNINGVQDILCVDSEGRRLIDDVNSKTTRNSESIENVKTRLTNDETVISNVNDKATTNANSITALSGRVAQAETKVDNADSNVSNIASQLSETNANLEVLSARMDEFSNLPEGSTAGDAELADIRIGANGTTYPNAGSAVRAQDSALAKWQEDFGYMKPTGDNLLDESACDNGYIGSNGILVLNTGSLDWKCTPFIDVSDYSRVSFSVKNSSNQRVGLTMYYFAKYDADKNFIERDLDEQTYYTVQNNVKYVRFSWHSTGVSEPMLQEGTPSTLIYEPYQYASHLHNSPYTDPGSVRDIINERYDEVYGINRNPNHDTAGYLNDSGVITAVSDWKTTDYCYVADLTLITASAKPVGSSTREKINLYFMCTYDENKNFIEQVYTIGNVSWYVTSSVKYVRFCYHEEEYENVMLEGGDAISETFVPYTIDYKLKHKYYDSETNWSQYKWVAFGDSLTEANLRTNKNYHGYIHDVTGIEVVNMGSSGTGYKRSEGVGGAFYQRILNVPNDADVVTIFGSGNDLSYAQMGFNTFEEALGNPTDTTTSTICGCINKTIDNLYTVNPIVQLALVTPTPWVDYPPIISGNNMAMYSDAIIAICKRRGILCLDLYHCSELRPWEASYRELCYSKDEGNGVHPNELGHKIIASHFKALLSKLLL